MKFIAVLFFIVLVCFGLYILLVHLKKINWKVVGVSAVFGAVLLALFEVLAWQSSKAPDTWCSHVQNATVYPPMQKVTAMDYFEHGNYDYDRGDCKGAVADYAKSVSLYAKYPQTYNNMAYTQMRMGDYQDALTNLDKAISLDPNYINALMNRGDVYNYYLKDSKKAITDYKKIIAISGTQSTSVCGHLLLAQHNGWNLGTVINIPFALLNCRNSSK